MTYCTHHNDVTQEPRLRYRARKLGWTIKKCPAGKSDGGHKGGYRVITAENTILTGINFEACLWQIECLIRWGEEKKNPGL